MQEFVHRWLDTTSTNMTGWVEEAFKQDQFTVRPSHEGNIPADDERHSLSVMDVFRSFNQTIDQIVHMNWDNDVHYAKFMTSLSKSIGAALFRYCELIEQKFAAEMEQLTIEQEPSNLQTRQDKWLQMAKEAWTSKEKIEPFHFCPEVSDSVVY